MREENTSDLIPPDWEDLLLRLDNKSDPEKYPNDGRPILVEDLRSFLENQINLSLLEAGSMDIGYFICATYIAEFLSKGKRNFQPDWYVINQQLKIAQGNGRPCLLEEGGKNCFIIAVLFPGIHPKTGFKTDYYVDMSANFFHLFYRASGLVIGSYMSDLAQEMVPITKRAFKL